MDFTVRVNLIVFMEEIRVWHRENKNTRDSFTLFLLAKHYILLSGLDCRIEVLTKDIKYHFLYLENKR